jgi:hypothetical protein
MTELADIWWVLSSPVYCYRLTKCWRQTWCDLTSGGWGLVWHHVLFRWVGPQGRGWGQSYGPLGGVVCLPPLSSLPPSSLLHPAEKERTGKENDVRRSGKTEGKGGKRPFLQYFFYRLLLLLLVLLLGHWSLVLLLRSLKPLLIRYDAWKKYLERKSTVGDMGAYWLYRTLTF